MKRRDFLTSSAGFGLAGALYPILGRTQAKPCPPSPLSVSGGTSVASACNSADAEADWLARSTGAGVVWAHDFRYGAEVDQFRDQGGVGTVPNIANSDGNCRRITTDGITGGACLELNIPGNSLVSVVGATAANPIRITTTAPHGLAVGEKVRFLGMTGGFQALNDTSGGGGGTIVTQTVSSVTSPTVFEISRDGAGYAAYSGGGTSSTVRVCKSGWWRPFSAIRAGDNGLPQDDVGGRRGEHPLRAWNSGMPQQNWRWQKDYYGHSDYHKQYPTWSGDSGVETDPWRGTDFWIQFRVKMPASRFNKANPSGKLVFIGTTGTTPLQEIVIMSRSNDPRQEVTSRYVMYTGGGYSLMLWKKRAGVGDIIQPGGAYDDPTDKSKTCYFDGGGVYGIHNCWEWPADEWVTVLVHVTPGRHFSNWNGTWPNGGDTAVQVWVAKQSELANGYVKIFDAGGFPFNFDTGGRHPPAWNSFLPTGYMNNVPAVEGWYHRFDQVIFSRQMIPCPSA